MRKLIYYPMAFILGIMFLSACNKSEDIDTILMDDTKRSQIIENIQNDQMMMEEFMATMMKNESAMMSMKENEDMMHKMMDESNMVAMMKENPEMRNNMMKKMNKEGIMSDECMKSCGLMEPNMDMEKGSMMEGDKMHKKMIK